VSLATITKETWVNHLDEEFQVHALSDQPLPIKLAAVSGYGRRMGGGREAYSLLFYGPLQPVLPQRIYPISHAEVGELEIFLVPIGPQAEGMGYEAVFT
jgi:hypothetical protein